MNLLKEGLGTAKIAEKLNLQLSTVSTYKARIFEKLGVKNIVELITKIK
jgi:two-component system invasion response regulator UvrY